MEYWQPFEPYEPPKSVHGMWSYKSTTDLYDFKKVYSSLLVKQQTNTSLVAVKSNPYMHHIVS